MRARQTKTNRGRCRDGERESERLREEETDDNIEKHALYLKVTSINR
jgi:hypothetical protein